MTDKISNLTNRTMPNENGVCQYNTYLRPEKMSMRDTIPYLCEALYYFENLCVVHEIYTKAKFEDTLNNYSDMSAHSIKIFVKKFYMIFLWKLKIA